MLNGLTIRLSSRLCNSVLIVILTIVSTTGHAGMLKSGFTVTYKVTHNGIDLGDAVRTLKLLDNGHWEYSSFTKANGLVRMIVKDIVNEVSEIEKITIGYRPLSYRYHQHGGRKEKKHSLIFNWKKNGWKTANKKSVKNLELWQELDEAVTRHNINGHWVKGHDGNIMNELADELANEGMERFKRM